MSSFQEGVEHTKDVLARRAGESDQDYIARRNDWTRSRRGVFRWMHVACSNDLVYGSWYYFWGSVLCIVIPLFPLAMIYEEVWTVDDYEHKHHQSTLPVAERTGVYSLLVLLGILYTVGSYAFLCSVETPRPAALFAGWHHLGNDEQFGMWCIFWGTVPCIPIMALYVAFNRTWVLYWFALAMSTFFTVLIAYAVYVCYPKKGETSSGAHWVYAFFPCLLREEYLAPLVRPCLPGSLKRHAVTDWLLLNWIMLWGCIAIDLICLALLCYAIKAEDNTAIFDWGTGLLDMLLFTAGGMYFVAGSYPSEEAPKAGEIKFPL
jgi:hypothetical protein